MSDLAEKDISAEAARTYVYRGGYEYHITQPVTLYARDGGTTHRVLDASGTVHCVPIADGDGPAVIRWTPKDPQQPVQF